MNYTLDQNLRYKQMLTLSVENMGILTFVLKGSTETLSAFFQMPLCFRPDGIGTVTVEEKERFEEIKERLRVLLENQITHFR